MPPVHAPDGTLVNAVVGFLNFLARLLADRKPGRLVVSMEFGSDWRPEFRVALLPEYKSHRVAAEDAPPDEVQPQLDIIAEVLRARDPGRVICRVRGGGCHRDAHAALRRSDRGRERRP